MPHSPIVGLIGFASLMFIFIGLTVASTNLVLDYRMKIATEELKAVGSSMSGQILEALSLASQSSSDETFYLRLMMPDECVSGHYSVELSFSEGKPLLILKPVVSVKPQVRVHLPSSIGFVSVVQSSVSSGARWNYVAVTPVGDDGFQLELVYFRGGIG